jgi:hypothetical protein
VSALMMGDKHWVMGFALIAATFIAVIIAFG